MAGTRRARKTPGGDAPSSATAERRRHDLLEAAYCLIAEKGLEGLRTRDIAARAGVNIATLHYYFATKEALLVAVVEYVPHKFTTAAPPAAPGRAARRSLLEAHLEEARRIFDADPNLNTVLQELTLRAHRDPAARAAFRAVHRGWNAVVEGVLAEAIAAGELRADLDPAAGARVVTGFVMGAMLQLGVNARAFSFEAVAAELAGWLSSPGRVAKRG